MTRVPQVGDVYIIDYGNVLSMFIVKQVGNYLLLHYQKENEKQRNDFYLPCNKEFGDMYNYDKCYMGKLAPRYKRLCGIYFIKDNTDD